MKKLQGWLIIIFCDSFIMLSQGKMMSTLIDKKMFNAEELKLFREFLKSLNLKKA